eukprot:TRINITY_DN9917_c0_g1_i1.p1 TRINITY_DN9917_c0_g1~~TRINITY_DN9917_c0_g1_i1.p1  ORF type:complete len:679 (-),score=120.65 TRINITY_DN9917_c0_g1_i1:1126-3162(-)
MAESSGPDAQSSNHKPEWVDVSKLFQSAAAGMKVGQLLLHEQSSLQEAMSAVEMLDPKMDTGVGLNDVLSAQEAKKAKKLPVASSLNSNNISAIMDKLLTAELLFYDGCSLHQTVLSCYYIHDLNNVDDPLLRVFCQVLLRRLLLLREKIIASCIGDDEEFWPHLFGFKCNLPEDKAILNAAKQAEDKAQSKAPALVPRLRANRLLLEIHLAFERAMKDHSQAPAAFSDAAALVAAAAPLFDQIQSSHVTEDTSIEKVFNPNLWKRFATTAPPRPIRWFDFTTAIGAWKAQVSHLGDMCQQLPMCTSVSLLFNLCDDMLSKKADLVVRAQLINCSCSNMRVVPLKGLPMTEWVQQEIIRFGGSKSVFTAECRDFFIYGARGIMRRLRTILANRSRTRRRLVHCFEDSSILITDGETLDEKQVPIALRGVEEGPRYMSRWALDWTLEEMQQWLLVGFELQVYEQYEYPIIWWYLDSLTGNRLQNQAAVLKYNEAQKHKLKALRDRRNKGPAGPPAPPPPTYHSLELEMQFGLNRAMVFVMALLVSSKKMELEPPGALSSAEARYYRRLTPFIRITTPGLANYRSYQKSFLEDLLKAPATELTKRALQHFSEAQTAIGKLLKFTEPAPSAAQAAELKKILRVCVMNGLAVGKWNPATSGPATFDFSTHPHYPVLDFPPVK